MLSTVKLKREFSVGKSSCAPTTPGWCPPHVMSICGTHFWMKSGPTTSLSIPSVLLTSARQR